MYKEDWTIKDVVFGEQRVVWVGPRMVHTFVARDEPVYLISHYRKVYDIFNGREIGILQLDVRERVIYDLYANALPYSNTKIFIIDSNKIVLSSSDEKDIGKFVSSIFPQNFPLNENSGIVTSIVKGISCIQAFHTVSTTGWKIVCLIPLNELRGDSRFIMQYIFIVFIGCFLFSIIFYILSTIIITRPIKELVSVIKVVESGNLDVRVPIRSNDEIALLGASFNRMLDNIKTLIKKNYDLQKQEKKAEILYFQSQINPHFLYNTLDSIRWMARKNNDFIVSEQIESLSNLFKHTLMKGGEFVTIEEELDHVKNYMVIQTHRFKNKIEFLMEVDDDVKNLYTIRLILQPLVENSIVHGLEPKMTKGFVKIKGYMQEGTVIIEVEDDGIGTDEGRIRQLISSDDENIQEMALRNINRRIKLNFGNEYGLFFFSTRDKGTRVVLKLPVLPDKPKSRWRNNYDTVDCG